jgi:two-component system nitrogen regulation response regulator GlnG
MNAHVQKILVADDDASIRLVLSQAFNRLGYQVRATGNATTLMKWVSAGEGDLVVTDVLMPDENVFDVLPRIRKQRPQLPVIVMSAQTTVLTAVSAAERGAYEYIPKPFDLDHLAATTRRALDRPADAAATRAQARALRDERLPLVGRSAPMQEVYRAIARLVSVDLPVLIQGESGSGKALTARALHDLGRRREGRFVAMSLASATAERVEAELFGRDGEAGKLAQADGGTLFLDRIGDASPDAQGVLLRVFDAEPAVNPRTGRRLDVRVVAAARSELADVISEGRFREDLYYRLGVATIRAPPLRERAEDIPDLARAFLLRAHRQGLPAKIIDRPALERLMAYGWPGNVRELENVIRRACVLHAEETITARIVAQELPTAAQCATAADAPLDLSTLVERRLAAFFDSHPLGAGVEDLYGRVLQDVERPLLQTTLAAVRDNQVQAARILGLNRNTLRHKIEELGVATRRRSRRAGARLAASPAC